VTEDDAKKKWCPMVRCESDDMVSNSFDMADNPRGRNPDYSLCIASDCMMWREDLTMKEAQNGFHALEGHCGLGGLL
jgi:hypothetical protein